MLFIIFIMYYVKKLFQYYSTVYILYIYFLLLLLYFCTCLVLQVEIDRRMLDFCVGLDTEFSEIVEGSHLYYPKTLFTQVQNHSIN